MLPICVICGQPIDPEQNAVDLVPSEHMPDAGWKAVLQSQDENERIVALIHEDTLVLRRMALFNVLVKNADRKGDHVLTMTDGHRDVVDHGFAFHSEDKPRTVLWG